MVFDYTNYDELTYLQSDGSAFIETGFYPTYSLCEMDILFPSLPSTLSYYLGSLATNAYYPLASSSVNKFGFRYGANVRWSDVDMVANTRYNIKSFGSANSQYLDIDNVRVLNRTDTFSINVQSNYLIFGYRTSGVNTPSRPYRLYYLRIYNTDNELMHEFIPARKKNGLVLGMYDTVDEVFYNNSGTGAFIGGEVIPHDTASMKLKANGQWKDTTPYIKVNGVWKQAIPYIKVNGVWKKAIQ